MPSSLSLLALLSIACTVLGAPQPPTPPTPPTPLRQVDLGYAKYQSNLSLEAGVTSFLGIRYAAPPTGMWNHFVQIIIATKQPLGQNRFKKPQPPAVVAGFQNATKQPTQCFQQFLEGAMGASSTNPLSSLSSVSSDIQSDDATEIAARDDPGVSSEDCLFLKYVFQLWVIIRSTYNPICNSVHVPTKPAVKGLLPVIVYIHGGG